MTEYAHHEATAQPPGDRAEPGVVTGRPAIWLRAEALAVAVAAVAVFATTGEP